MLLGLALGADLPPDHVYDLLPHYGIIQVETLQRSDQLATGGDLARLIRQRVRVIIAIGLVKALELLDFLEKANGFDLSGSKERGVSELGLGSLSATN